MGLGPLLGPGVTLAESGVSPCPGSSLGHQGSTSDQAHLTTGNGHVLAHGDRGLFLGDPGGRQRRWKPGRPWFPSPPRVAAVRLRERGQESGHHCTMPRRPTPWTCSTERPARGPYRGEGVRQGFMFGWRILAVAVDQGHEGWGPREGFTGILESTNPPGAMTWAHVWLSARRIFFRLSEDHNQKYPKS